MQLSLEFWAVCFSSFTPEVWCRESGWFCTALRRTKLRRVGEYWCEQFGQCLFEGFLQKQSLSAETRRSFMCGCIIHSASAGGYNDGSERICCVEALRQGTIYCSGQQCREDAGWSRPWVCESGQSERQCPAIFFALLYPFVLFCSFNSLDYWKGLKSWEDLRRVTALWTASSAASSVCFILGFADAGRVSLTSPSHKQLSSLMRLLAVRKWSFWHTFQIFSGFGSVFMLCNSTLYISLLRKLKTIYRARGCTVLLWKKTTWSLLPSDVIFDWLCWDTACLNWGLRTWQATFFETSSSVGFHEAYWKSWLSRKIWRTCRIPLWSSTFWRSKWKDKQLIT